MNDVSPSISYHHDYETIHFVLKEITTIRNKNKKIIFSCTCTICANLINVQKNNFEVVILLMQIKTQC